MAEVLLYGVIGDPADGLDAKTVGSAIRKGTGPLAVRINSPGGIVTEGMAIVAALRAYPGKVTTYIDGLAASMASVIAMIGAEVIMAESALMMVHKPSSAAFGTADDMRDGADQLDLLERQCVAIYAQRTGLPDEDLARMLAAETWMDASTALELGFVTSIAEPLRAVAMAKATGYGFHHLPDRLKDPTMTDNSNVTVDAVAAERQRVSAIMSLANKHNIPTAMMQSLVTTNATLEAARERMLDHLAASSDAMNIGNRFNGTLADPAFAAKAMSDALYAKLTGKPPEGAARELMSMSMVDMARAMAEQHGVRGARTMRPEQVLNAAAWNRGQNNAGWDAQAAITHTTGDFPDLLTAAGHRFLLDVYQAAASPMKLLGRARTATDFRPIFGLQLSNFGTLNQVNEGGEIKHGTFTVRKNSYQLGTFAKQFSLTRQAIINDDLGAFSDVMTIMARAAAETEAQVLAELLASNPVMDDGHPLFDAAHNNYAAAGVAPSSPPSIVALSAARLAMRTQKDMDGVTPIGSAPKFILTGPALETQVEQMLTTITPNGTEEVNPFAGKLTPLVDPRITGVGWDLFADPALTPTLEYANLNGANGPNVEQQNGWDVLGQAFRVYHDFGAGFVDWRGAYRNDGIQPA